MASPLKEQPKTVSYTVYKAQQEILGLLKTTQLELTPSLKDQLSRVFETLCDNLKEAAVDFQFGQEGKPRPTYSKEFAKKLQALHEDFTTLQQSLGTNSKLLAVEFDKINVDLGILKNSSKLPSQERSRMDSLRSSPGRSRSSQKDDAWGAKIGSIQAQLSKLLGELSKRNEKISKYEELFGKQDRVVRSLLSSYTQALYSKERDNKEEQKNTINYEAILKQKDEEILRLNTAYKLCAQRAAVQPKPRELAPTIERPFDGMLEKICTEAGNLLSTLDRLKSAVARSDDTNIDKYKYALDSEKKTLWHLINSVKHRMPLPHSEDRSKIRHHQSDEEIMRLTSEKKELEEKLISQSLEMQQYENKLLDYIEKVKKLTQELEAQKKENPVLKSSRPLINCAPIKSLIQKASRSVDSEMKALRDQCARKTNQIARVISKIPVLHSAVKSATQQLNDNSEKVTVLTAANDRLKREQSSTQREIAKLRKIIDDKEKSGNSEVLEKEKQLQEAREILELAGEECQNSLKQVWEFSVDQFQSKIQELEYMVDEKTEKLERMKEKLASLIQVYEAQIETISSEYEKLHETYESQQSDIAQLNEANSELNSQLSKQVEIKKKYTEEITKLKKENIDLEKNIDAQKDSNQILLDKNDQLSQEIKAIKSSKPKIDPTIELKEHKEAQQRLQKALDDSQNKNKNQLEEIERINNLNDSLSSKLKKAESDYESLSKENTKLKKDFTKYKENLEISEKTAKRRKDSELEDETNLLEIQTQLADKSDEIATLQSQLSESNNNVQTLYHKYSQLASVYKSYHETALLDKSQAKAKIEKLKIGFENTIDSIKQIIDQTENTKEVLTQTLERLNSEKEINHKLQKELLLSKTKINEDKKMNENLILEKDTLIQENEDKIDQLNQDVIQKEEENYGLSEEIEELKQQLSKYSEQEKNLANTGQQLKTAQAELAEAKKMLEKEKKINANLTAENTELKNSQTFNSEDEVETLRSQLITSHTQNRKMKEIINSSLPSMRDYLIIQRRANDEIQQYVIEYERYLSSSLELLANQFNNVLQYIIELEEKCKAQNEISEEPSNRNETIETLTTVIINLREELGDIKQNWESLTRPIDEFKLDFALKISELRKYLVLLARKPKTATLVQDTPQLISVLQDMNDLDKKHSQIGKNAILLLKNMKSFLGTVRSEIVSYKMQMQEELHIQGEILQSKLVNGTLAQPRVSPIPVVPNITEIEQELMIIDKKQIRINQHATNFLHSIKDFLFDIKREFVNYQSRISNEFREKSKTIKSKILTSKSVSSGSEIDSEKINLDVLGEVKKLEAIHQQIGKNAANSVLNLKSFIEEIRNFVSTYCKDISREIANKSRLIMSSLSKVKPLANTIDKSILFHIKDTLQEIQIAQEEIKESCGEHETSSDVTAIMKSIQSHLQRHEKLKNECEEQSFERLALQSQIAMQSSITHEKLEGFKQDFSEVTHSVNELAWAIPDWIEKVQILQENIKALSDELLDTQEKNYTLQFNFENEISQKDSEIEALNKRISELKIQCATQDEVHVEHSRRKKDQMTLQQSPSKQAQLQIDSLRKEMQDLLNEYIDFKEEYIGQIDLVKNTLMDKLNQKEAEMQIVQDNLETTTQNIAIVLLPCASMFSKLRAQLVDLQKVQDNLQNEIMSTHKEHNSSTPRKVPETH